MNFTAHVANIPAWNVEPFSNRLFLKDVVKNILCEEYLVSFTHNWIRYQDWKINSSIKYLTFISVFVIRIY